MIADTTQAPTSARSSDSLDPTLAERWRRWRWVVLAAVTVVLSAVALTVVSDQERSGYLNPTGSDAWGARALAQLLEAQGVQITEVRTTDAAVAAAAQATTLLITVPDLLRTDQVAELLDTGSDLVLAAPSGIVTAFDSDVRLAGTTEPATVEPQCDLPAAERAGPALVGGLTYLVDEPAIGSTCYADSLVVTQLDGDRQLVALGSADAFVNSRLDEDGNAALALGLLGGHPELIWYRPLPEAQGDAEASSLTELLPDWVRPAAWQLGIAGLLAAFWRGRRLGPVVTEPLPVIVRAAETTEGRARLYRRGRARGHAADTLRAATTVRLRAQLGLPSDTTAPTVAEAVAARTGRPSASVVELLAGDEPSDDATLVRLADDLDVLEQEVRKP